MKDTLRLRFACLVLLAGTLLLAHSAWGQQSDTASDSAAEPAAETAAESESEPSGEQPNEPAEKSAKESAEKSAEKSADDATEESTEESTEDAPAAEAAGAAQWKPVIVASIASHQRMIDRLRFIGKASPNDPDGASFLKSATGLLSSLAKIEGLDLEQVAGIDAGRPWGMAVISDGLDMIPYVFVPVADLEPALQTLKPLLGEAKALEDGVYEIDASKLLGLVPAGGLLVPTGVEMYLKLKDGWLYGVQLQEHFDRLLAPDELLGEGNTEYDATLSFHVRNVPEALRSMLVDRAADIQIPGLPTTPTRMPDEPDSQFAFRQQLSQQMLQFGSQVFRDAERVVMGLAVDKDAEQLVAEMTCVAVADTPLARHFADLAEVQTRLGSLGSTGGEEEVMAAGVTVKLDETRQASFGELLESYRKAVSDLIDNEPAVADEARQAYRELVDQWAGVMQSAVQHGTLDAALRITAGAGRRPPWTMVAGIALPDTAPMEQLVRRLGELIEQEQETGVGTVKWDVAQQGDVSIHEIVLQVPSNAGPQLKLVQKVFGGLNFHFATTPEVAWLAVGPDGLSALKAALEGGASASKSLRLVARAAPFFPILGQTLDSQEIAMGLTLMSTQLMAGDTARVTIDTTDRTLRLRGTADKGFMTLTTMLAQLVPSLLNQGN